MTADPATSAPPDAPESSRLAADLRQALLLSARRLRSEKADEGVTDAQYSVLAGLDRRGPANPGELADRERVQPPTMTRLLGSLLERGLIDRAASTEDRRQVIITLTPAGRDVVLATRLRRNEWLSDRLADLTPGERVTLADATRILRRIADT